MLLLIALFTAKGADTAPIKSADVVMAPLATLVKILGPLEPAPPRKTFLTFHPKGFAFVTIDAAGPKMKGVDFVFDDYVPWSKALPGLGLGVARVKPHPIPDPAGKFGLKRNALALDGASGFSKSKQGWHVTYDEYGVLNKAKIAQKKAEIKSLSGGQRLQLIRTCYDWHSEIHLRAP